MRTTLVYTNPNPMHVKPRRNDYKGDYILEIRYDRITSVECRVSRLR